MILFMGILSAGFSALVDNNGAYWTLDNVLIDSTGNGHTLSNYGATYIGGGKINGAYEFDGINDYMLTSYDVGVEDDFTYNLWLYDDGVSLGRVFDIYSGGTQYYRFHKDTASTIKFISRDTANIQLDLNSVTISSSGWESFTITRDSSANELKMYKNGVIVQTLTDTRTGNFNAGNLVIGKNSAGSNSYYDGDIDEFSFWSRALDSTEILELYNGGVGNQYPYSIAPIISPITPTHTQIYTYDVESVNIEITSDVESDCVFDDGAGNVSLITSDDLTHTYSNYDLGVANTSVKQFDFSYYCTDISTSEVGTKDITFYQDQVPLSLEIYIPQDQQHFNYDTQIIEFYIETNYVADCNYKVFNMTNYELFTSTHDAQHKTNYSTFYPNINEYPVNFSCDGVNVNETIFKSVTFYIDEDNALNFEQINSITQEGFSIMGNVANSSSNLMINIVPITIVGLFMTLFGFIIMGLGTYMNNSLKKK